MKFFVFVRLFLVTECPGLYSKGIVSVILICSIISNVSTGFD